MHATHAALRRPADAWAGHWAAYPGWTSAASLQPPRRRRPLVIALILAVLLPVALIGTCVASLIGLQDELTEQATLIMTACSPSGDDQTCREALGPASTDELVAEAQVLLNTAEEQRGAFRSVQPFQTCHSTTPTGSVRELRAHVEWDSGSEAIAFQWTKQEGGWQLSRLAAAGIVPRACG